MKKLALLAAAILAIAAPAQAGGPVVTAYSQQVVLSQAPTVTSGSAYAAGNVVGGLLTFAGAGRDWGATGYVQRVVVDMKSNQSSTGGFDLILFGLNPTNSTFTDKSALSIAVTDFDKDMTVVHVTDCVATGTTSVCQAQGLANAIQTASDKNLYGVLVAKGAPTFTSTADVKVTIQVIQD